ncbi:Hypothetical predicted protein [Pelobates cultripes]|uniref:Uncharacterized protein n=1 Tax=Pelobates cultripes TaxID=61616 RepID=A0AAD1SAN3_PELCU|nr:Hypothetical predicted protein [Pelobates cultripes]
MGTHSLKHGNILHGLANSQAETYRRLSPTASKLQTRLNPAHTNGEPQLTLLRVTWHIHTRLARRACSQRTASVRTTQTDPTSRNMSAPFPQYTSRSRAPEPGIETLLAGMWSTPAGHWLNVRLSTGTTILHMALQ